MSTRLTLQMLADHLIRESRSPFTADDFARRMQESWSRKISPSTLDRLKQRLSAHYSLIGIDSSDYLPYHAVLEKIRHLPLSIIPAKFEKEQKIFIPGHRLIPFISNERKEADLTILCPNGKEIAKIKKSCCIEEIIYFYHYSGESHFPDDIRINEIMPGKSSFLMTVWDMREFYKTYQIRPGDALLLRLVDYDHGIFQIRHYPRKQLRLNRIKMRSLFVTLEKALSQLCEERGFCSLDLEKQILRGFFVLDSSCLNAPAFSLTDFLESLEILTVVQREDGSVHLFPGHLEKPDRILREETPKVPKGEKGSLEEIFRDLGLAFNESEFIAILYSVMSTEKYKIESVFQLLFGSQGKLFLDKKQHEAFYSRLRKLLYKICDDLKKSGSPLIDDLRDQCVEVKLSLIEVLRFLETNEVGLGDLTSEILDQICDLDRFCMETLSKFADRNNPPDLKFIRDARMALKIIFPHLTLLEKEIYSHMVIY